MIYIPRRESHEIQKTDTVTISLKRYNRLHKENEMYHELLNALQEYNLVRSNGELKDYVLDELYMYRKECIGADSPKEEQEDN